MSPTSETVSPFAKSGGSKSIVTVAADGFETEAGLNVVAPAAPSDSASRPTVTAAKVPAIRQRQGFSRIGREYIEYRPASFMLIPLHSVVSGQSNAVPMLGRRRHRTSRRRHRFARAPVDDRA